MIYNIKTYECIVKSGLLMILPNSDFNCTNCFVIIRKDTNP